MIDCGKFFVHRSRSLQKQMMIQHKGLESLKRVFQSSDEDTNSDTGTMYITPQFATVQSLLFLAEELKVHWSKLSANEGGSSNTLIAPVDHDVTFVMDDGRHVTGSRTMLSATSTVFAAMLEGAYKESEQTEITIQHGHTEAFQLLIKHLHGCDIQTALESIQTDNPLDMLLEALALSDRYMIEALEAEISKYISAKHMAKETLPNIFEVGCVHTCTDLVKSCFQFALAGDLGYKESSDTLNDMFSGSHVSFAFDALRKLIRDKLATT